MFFRAGATPSLRRNVSVGPGLAFYRDEDEHLGQSPQLGTPRDRRTASRDQLDVSPRGRRLSADSSIFQREIISHNENPLPFPISLHTPALGSTDNSAQRHPLFNSLSATVSRIDDNAAHTLEESRNILRAGRGAGSRSM